jgi:hypothetical protein
MPTPVLIALAAIYLAVNIAVMVWLAHRWVEGNVPARRVALISKSSQMSSAGADLARSSRGTIELEDMALEQLGAKARSVLLG